MEKYMNIAINEAKKSLKNGDVPVGALIIKNNNIVSIAHNEKEIKKNAIKHAEIIAIEKACKKLKTWHLDDCELYTTMEPCIMCCGAIIQSRIKKITYGVTNKKYGFSKILNEKYNVKCLKYPDNQEIIQILKKFFEDKR